jgi:hypothetical protein
MVELKFPCPQCGQSIQCGADYIGKQFSCPACRLPIAVPFVNPAKPSDERVIQIKVSTLKKAATIALCLIVAGGLAVFALRELTRVTVLKGSEHLDTPQSYRPPVEITIVAKTDSTNLRMAYAADQVIFNWELDRWQLRVDGGPANGLHKKGAGHIPKNTYVTIKWIVTTTRQEIFVNGDKRYEHEGDYSQIDRPVSVFPANGSTVTVKSVTVKPVPNSTR